MLLEKIKKLNNHIVIIIILFVLLYIFIGNNNKADNQYIAKQDIEESYNAPMLKTSMRAVNYEVESKIVRGYGLTIEVKNTSNIYSVIIDEMTKVAGIINSFNSYNYTENDLAYNFVLEIPTDKIDSSIEYFKSLGIIKNENSNADDLTEQYSDNENRLKNLYSRRERLRKMMENKTEKLSDVLAVDRELNNVQTEIERLEKSNKKIDKNVEYSKLELTIEPKIKVNSLNDSQWQVSTSWNKAINKFIIFGQKSIDYIFQFITLLPIIIIFVLLVVLVKKIKNKLI